MFVALVRMPQKACISLLQ